MHYTYAPQINRIAGLASYTYCSALTSNQGTENIFSPTGTLHLNQPPLTPNFSLPPLPLKIKILYKSLTSVTHRSTWWVCCACPHTPAPSSSGPKSALGLPFAVLGSQICKWGEVNVRAAGCFLFTRQGRCAVLRYTTPRLQTTSVN